MTDETLKTLLSAYAAPTPDEGFSDSVMARVKFDQAASVNVTVDPADFAPTPSTPRRSWVIAFVLGLMAGLLWVWLGIDLPDVPASSELTTLMDTKWTLYVLVAMALAGTILFLEADFV